MFLYYQRVIFEKDLRRTFSIKIHRDFPTFCDEISLSNYSLSMLI